MAKDYFIFLNNCNKKLSTFLLVQVCEEGGKNKYLLCIQDQNPKMNAVFFWSFLPVSVL